MRAGRQSQQIVNVSGTRLKSEMRIQIMHAMGLLSSNRGLPNKVGAVLPDGHNNDGG
jgi:hypothetical protein